MKNDDVLKQYKELAYNADKIIQSEFSSISFEQLCRQPSSDKWSIGQCFQHLIISNSAYIPFLQRIRNDKERETFTFKHTFWGKLLLKTLDPDSSKKVKTTKNFNPLITDVKETVIEDYLHQREILGDVINSLEGINLSVHKINSPFFKLIKYNAGDAILVIAKHDLRHIQQALKVKQSGSYVG